jgi:hypothetical protein
LRQSLLTKQLHRRLELVALLFALDTGEPQPALLSSSRRS